MLCKKRNENVDRVLVYWRILEDISQELNHVSLCDVWVRIRLYETKSLSPCGKPNLNRISFFCQNNKGFLFQFFSFFLLFFGGNLTTWHHNIQYLYWVLPLEQDGKLVSEGEECGKWKTYSAKYFEWLRQVLYVGRTKAGLKKLILFILLVVPSKNTTAVFFPVLRHSLCCRTWASVNSPHAS